MGVKKLPNGRWEVSYRDGSNKRHRPRFDTKAEAEHFEAEQKRAVRRGTYVDPKLARGVTVRQLWDKYRDHLELHGGRAGKGLEPKTLADYDYWAEMVLDDWRDGAGRSLKIGWEHTPLANVSRQGVTEWVGALPAKTGGPASAHAKQRVSKFFQRMMAFAASEGLIERSPLLDNAGRPLPAPRPERAKTQVRLTMPQLARLASAAGDHGLLVMFAGVTGLRWGEVSTLRVRHLEFGERPSVFVERDVSKTDVEREVPIPRSVARALQEAIGDRGPEEVVFPSRQGRVLDEKNFGARHYRLAGEAARAAVATLAERLKAKPDYRRVQRDGRAERVAVFSDAMLRAMHGWQEAVGLDKASVTTPGLWRSLSDATSDPVLKRLERVEMGLGDVDFLRPTFHNLRHTAVSLAIEAGGNVKAVQRIAGHKSAAVTLDVYADLFEDHIHDVAAHLDDALALVPQALALLSSK